MGLRIATIDDLELIMNLSLKFIHTTDYSKFADEDKMRNIWTKILLDSNEDSIILLFDEDGMMAGIKAPFLYGTLFVATELAWWVEPDKRKTNIGTELLEAFEYWAKKVGCSLVTMISLDDKLGKYYKKKGYKLYERAYMKEI